MQLGQVNPSAVRHFPRNYLSARLSDSHFGQRIGSLYFHGPMRSIARTRAKEKGRSKDSN